MKEGVTFFSESIGNQEKANELMEQLIAVADAKSVYSDPIESGDYKVITASEVRVGMGFGYGGGGGVEATKSETEEEEESTPGSGYGGGGGGGGAAFGRPVAAIEIGPQGVRVEPIVDPTKIAIAFFTTMVSMFAMMGRIKRGTRL
ncbi:MAG: hypothetical protein PVH03_03645 [Chloroflexota bacterium]|jgi:uncharacterized spore protein YtfJ